MRIGEHPAATTLAARTLLLIHGRFGGSATFEPLLAELGGRYHAIVPDLPGFGGSFSARERGLPVTEICELVAAIARESGAHSRAGTIIAGHDVGGAIAQICAARFPELFSSVVLMGSSSAFLPSGIRPELRGVRERIKFLELKRELEASGVHPPERPWRNASAASWLRYLRACAETWPGMYERQYWRRELGRAAFPSLLLWGGWDSVHPVEEARELARALQDSELHENERCGYWLPLEDPEWTAERIRQFVFRTETEAGLSLFRRFPSR